MNKIDGKVESISKSEWNTVYDFLYGGFEDIGDEDSDLSSDDEDDEADRTKEGYVKDGFIVDDEEEYSNDNNRQTTGDFYYAGNAGAGAGTRQMKSYEAEYNQRNNDVKSSTIDGRMVPGNMKLMNGDINMRQVNRDDFLKNNRAVAGTMPYQSMDVANMGQLQGQNNLYQNIQMDRNNGEALNALKGNPYVLNHVKGL